MNRPPSGRAAAARRGACALLAAALLVRAAAAPEPSHAALRCPRRAGPGLPAHCEYTGGNNSTEYQYRVEGKYKEGIS